jgi:hypothetical protein
MSKMGRPRLRGILCPRCRRRLRLERQRQVKYRTTHQTTSVDGLKKASFESVPMNVPAPSIIQLREEENVRNDNPAT